MNARILANWTSIIAATLILTGCATRTVVVPKPVHVQDHNPKYVVYHVRPAKKHCWRHRNHWDCR